MCFICKAANGNIKAVLLEWKETRKQRDCARRYSQRNESDFFKESVQSCLEREAAYYKDTV